MKAYAPCVVCAVKSGAVSFMRNDILILYLGEKSENAFAGIISYSLACQWIKEGRIEVGVDAPSASTTLMPE
jgi:hypothetical protein